MLIPFTLDVSVTYSAIMKEAILLRFFIQGKLAVRQGVCRQRNFLVDIVLFYMNFISAKFSEIFLTRSNH